MNAAPPEVVAEEVAVLDIIGRAEAPVGSRQITRELAGQGFTLSESTVSRRLRKLDHRHLTRPAGAKGRVLTEAGHRQLDELRAMRHRRPASYVDIRTIRDLLDLLRARRAIEREAARAAAASIDEADLRQLRGLIEQHQAAIARGGRRTDAAHAFHLTILRSSGNKLLRAMGELAFDPALDGAAAALDFIIGNRSRELMDIRDHREVLEALAAGDGDSAERAMLRHLDRLIHEVEAFQEGDSAAVLDRVVAWMAGEAGALVRRG